MSDNFLTRTTERLDLRRWWVFAQGAARQGGRRVRGSLLPILQAAVGAAIAWELAVWLRHDQPIFAPIAAWVCLGFKVDRVPRKVAELGVGATVGVAAGELFAFAFGTGWWQIGIVLVIGALVGRFVDRGDLTTMQAGVNAVVIVGMAGWGATGGIQGRWVEALLGAGVAFIIAVLLPRHPMDRPRRYAVSSILALADMLDQIARGLTSGDPELLADAKGQRRLFAQVTNDWEQTIATARDVVAFNPSLWRHRVQVTEVGRLFRLTRRTSRALSLLERQALAMVEEVGPMPEVGSLVADAGRAARALAGSVRSWTPPENARAQLVAVAARAAPGELHPEHWRAVALTVVTRAVIVDLLQMTGLSRAAALALLAESEGRPFADVGGGESDDGASAVWG